VPRNPVLAPEFTGMAKHHCEHVAAFIAEVFGAAADYTSAGGSHAGMIRKLMGRHLTHKQRKRWIALFVKTVDEAGSPDDPEFRAALVG
jgi:hemoglobin